jgi:hypothetical protein
MLLDGQVVAGGVPDRCGDGWCLVPVENSNSATAPPVDGRKGCEESSDAVWKAAMVLLASTDDEGGDAMVGVLYE